MATPLTHLRDLTPDKNNANKGTARGRSLLAHSLQSLGAGRSIVTDTHGVVIAGNKTLEAALALSLPIQEIATDGTTLIVVRRTDLDLAQDRRAKALALADNRTSEIGLAWDIPVLTALEIDLQPWFLEAEVTALQADDQPREGFGTMPDVKEEPDTLLSCPKCGFRFAP